MVFHFPSIRSATLGDGAILSKLSRQESTNSISNPAGRVQISSNLAWTAGFCWRGWRISLEGISLQDQETKPRRGLLKDLLEQTWLSTSRTFYGLLNVKLCVRQWGERMSSNDIVSISTEMTGCGALWCGSLRRAVAAQAGRFAASHLDAWPRIILLVKPEIEIEWITLGSTLLKLSLRNELCPHN